ncbi:MAG: DUF721 domain-containing protein [Brevundimonas sp.]|nr:MAG: DUF721 domain-containing protein [Brevundimonas sp.]
MKRPLPTEAEAREILARRRTRPAPRPAPKAGKALHKLVRELDDRFGKGAGALEPRWREIVGERLARVTRPQKLTKGRGNAGGTLEMKVAGAAALLVQHQSQEIIDRVNLFLGPGSVERLRISQGPIPPLKDATGTRARQRGRGPLAAADEAALGESLTEAPEGLRASLGRLGRAVLREKR